MKYKSVVITKKGSPEVLKIIENDLRQPKFGETRIKILATGVGRTDIQGVEKVTGWLTRCHFKRSDKHNYHALPTSPATISQLAGRFACLYSQSFVMENSGVTFSSARW